MILIEKTQIMGLEPTIRGMRNPMNSWDKSDSGPCLTHGPAHCADCPYPEGTCSATEADLNNNYIIGPTDLDLMLRLARTGSVDGKFRRMIAVYVDITAPLYWWKEFDTYKVGTVTNSCSTMHKIHAKEFTLDDFSHEHLISDPSLEKEIEMSISDYEGYKWFAPKEIIEAWIIPMLNKCREKFLETKDKLYWWQMIQLLPSSYNQKRTVMLNYEVLSNIYQHRRNHKLDEWRKLCKWIEGLPYSEVITCNTTKNNEITAAIAKLKAEQWSEDQIANLLLSQTKKEQLKLFADDADKTPVHGGAFDVPAIMADGSKNY